MDRLKGKLASRRGETLVEVLVSILLAGLSMLMLMGMISAAVRLNGTARQADAQFYEELSAAEGRTQEVDGSASLSLVIGGQTTHIDVAVYGTQDGLAAYAGQGAGP